MCVCVCVLCMWLLLIGKAHHKVYRAVLKSLKSGPSVKRKSQTALGSNLWLISSVILDKLNNIFGT